MLKHLLCHFWLEKCRVIYSNFLSNKLVKYNIKAILQLVKSNIQVIVMMFGHKVEVLRTSI